MSYPWQIPAVAGLLVALQATAQAPADPAARTTVTASQGDVGGWHFGRRPPAERVRRYFIAAEEVPWAFALNSDPVCGNAVPANVQPRPDTRKLRYVQYQDGTFTTPVLQPRHLGILGPVLRGVVGDYLVVTLYNRTSRPVSMHPHGVKYDKDSEGAWYLPEPGLGAGVGPGAGFTYVWKIDEAAGPTPSEPASKAWLYHSHVMGDEEINLGLAGFLVVTDPKRARPDGTPTDVDRELGTLFMIFDDALPGANAEEVVTVSSQATPAVKQAAAVQFADEAMKKEQGLRHGINGLAFGALPGLDLIEGERVRWYLFALGAEQDLHTAHWHGLRATDPSGRSTDLVELLPGSMKSVDLAADNPGHWLFHCHVGDHMMEGMYAGTVVHPGTSQIPDRIRNERWYPSATNTATWRVDSMAIDLPADRSETNAWRLRVTGAFAVPGRPAGVGTPVEFRIGSRTKALVLDQRGEGKAESLVFRSPGATAERGARPANEQAFQVEFDGAELAREARHLGLVDAAAPAKVHAPLELHVGRATHKALMVVTRAEPTPGGTRLIFGATPPEAARTK